MSAIGDTGEGGDAIVDNGKPVARRIRSALEAALAPLSLDVIDESRKHAKHAHMMTERSGTAIGSDETHFKIKVVAAGFEGKSRLERHRTVNALLAPEMGPGKVHAVSIDARAPGE